MEPGLTLNGFKIVYGQTTVRELCQAGGYTVSDLAQIIEEPTLATCNLNRQGVPIASLNFYHSISEGDLPDTPIDLVLDFASDVGGFRKSSLARKLAWNGLVHLLVATIFLGFFVLPEWFAFMHSSVAISFVFLMLPALASVAIWSKNRSSAKGPDSPSNVIPLVFVINICLTVVYFRLIEAAFI